MKGTREATLQRINKWTTELMAPNILWLKGHPGIGKTAIATEIVEQLASVGRLGSSFFFQRQQDAVLTPQALWRTVAYDLARKHPTIRGTVVAKLKEGAVPLTTAKLENLFRHFIRDPLLLSGEIPNGRLPVIVIENLQPMPGQSVGELDGGWWVGEK
jgi:MoxR-like ATPase